MAPAILAAANPVAADGRPARRYVLAGLVADASTGHKL